MAMSPDTSIENTPPPSLIAKVRVSVPISIPNTQNAKSEFDYVVGSTLKLEKGCIVEVSFANRIIWGVVYECNYETEIEHSKLKPILSVSSASPINNATLAFLNQVSEWTMAPFGQILKMMLCVPNALKSDAPVMCYGLSSPAQSNVEQLSASRQKIIAWCQHNPPVPANILARETGVSNSTVLAMVKAGQLEKIEVSPRQNRDIKTTLSSLTSAIRSASTLNLSPEQIHAAQKINETENGFSVALLDGVTGSGKTEVYFELVKKQILLGRQCLILLPEIVLTTSWVNRFKKWVGFMPNIWHSGISAGKKKRIWREINEGHPGVVVGARSALFLPFSNLGAIIVDEEHEAGYKQEEQVIYHARDMAILRAKYADCSIVLATATPSLESWINVRNGRYQHIILANRYGVATMPDIQTIDLRKFKPAFGKWISEPLLSDMQDRLKSDQQILLYLNRRGYAPLAVCSECGVKQSCHQCDSLLVTHRLSNQLRCHQCGIARPFQNRCQSCGQTDSIQLVGPGVERLAEEVYQLFPEASVTILSSDTLTNPAQMALTIKSIEEGEVDIIIGTQMVAKGHHFPKLTCVAVIDGDLGLSGSDLRASERTYQLLTQVAGRSGREKQAGTVFIQTAEPTHPVLQALKSQNRDAYFELEMEMRRSANMPPYRRLAAIIYSSLNELALADYVKTLASHKPQFEDVQIFGPAPAPIYQIKGRYRVRFLINAPKQVNIQKIIQGWNANITMPSTIRRQIDIDPYNFM
ncbi:primosomal protein N' [Alphaproteobacteria bacterium]|nr:primosomal protein N' [Alphaproteobacteria bacterium]